jgi:hypothetical protein
MFIETYYDERAAILASTSEPMIPYPELSGEELAVWQEYLPIRREIRKPFSRFNTIPDLAIAEIKKATRSFDRIEIWSPWPSESSEKKSRVNFLSCVGGMRNSG